MFFLATTYLKVLLPEGFVSLWDGVKRRQILLKVLPLSHDRLTALCPEERIP